MKASLGMAFLLVAVVFARNDPAPAFARAAAAGRIEIEYGEAKNPDHQALVTQLKDRKALEKIQAIFTPFRLPQDITIKMVGCDGDANAWYERVNGRPTITLCYEYLYVLWTHLPTDTTEDGLTPTDALVGQALFAVAHEFGHLAFNVYRVPLLAREEDAADNFATFIMLHFRQDGRRLIMGAAWSYKAFIKDYRLKTNTTLPLAAFSSNHGQPEERFYNMMCIAYGSDPKGYAGIVDKGYLPKSRAGTCEHEFKVLQFGFSQQILPHIDRKKGDKVLSQDWLATAQPPSPLR